MPDARRVLRTRGLQRRTGHPPAGPQGGCVGRGISSCLSLLPLSPPPPQTSTSTHLYCSPGNLLLDLKPLMPKLPGRVCSFMVLTRRIRSGNCCPRVDSLFHPNIPPQAPVASSMHWGTARRNQWGRGELGIRRSRRPRCVPDLGSLGREFSQPCPSHFKPRTGSCCWSVT